MVVVIDASVLVDIFLASRPRHAEATKLRTLLKSAGARVRVPMHAMFELASAMRQEKLAAGGRRLDFNAAITQADAFPIEAIAIDEAFLHKYLSLDLPDLRSGDLIYVALAKGDGLDLVTEDNNQYLGSKQAGVLAYKIAEYIHRLQSERSGT